MKLSQTAYYKVREITSPIREEFRGFRVVVAWPNLAGHKPFSNDPAPSFQKPYLMYIFGDYESYEVVTQKLPGIKKWLYQKGFTKLLVYKDGKLKPVGE